MWPTAPTHGWTVEVDARDTNSLGMSLTSCKTPLDVYKIGFLEARGGSRRAATRNRLVDRKSSKVHDEWPPNCIIHFVALTYCMPTTNAHAESRTRIPLVRLPQCGEGSRIANEELHSSIKTNAEHWTCLRARMILAAPTENTTTLKNQRNIRKTMDLNVCNHDMQDSKS